MWQDYPQGDQTGMSITDHKHKSAPVPLYLGICGSSEKHLVRCCDGIIFLCDQIPYQIQKEYLINVIIELCLNLTQWKFAMIVNCNCTHRNLFRWIAIAILDTEIPPILAIIQPFNKAQIKMIGVLMNAWSDWIGSLFDLIIPEINPNPWIQNIKRCKHLQAALEINNNVQWRDCELEL
jgi:hypothetical protein